MYKTIILDCQSFSAELSCGDCIAYRNCEMSRQKHSDSTSVALAPS